MRSSTTRQGLLVALLMVAMMLITAAPAFGVVGGTIEGTVVDESGTAIPNITVDLYSWGGASWSWMSGATASTDANGDYTLQYHPDGDYRVFFRDINNSNGGDWAYEWYDDAINESERTTVTIEFSSTETADATLSPGGSISGRVKNERGAGIESAVVRAYYEHIPGVRKYTEAAVTDADGYYTITNLPADDYTLWFKWTYDSTYADEWWNDTDWGNAVWFPLGAAQHVTGYDTVLEYTDQVGPAVSSDIKTDYVGKATIKITGDDSATGDSGIYYTYYDLDHAGWKGTAGAEATVVVDKPGEHTITYKAKDNAWNYSEYVTKTFTITRDEEPVAEEVAGANRYSTAVAASKEGFDTAPAVVIATGTNWPDALGGSALAGAIDGPLLLTKPDALAENVKAEVERLEATEAYIVGGLAAVSQEVEDALLELLGEGNVHRLAGNNRYATADAIAAEVIEQLDWRYDGNAFCATGADFPDALAASSMAAAKGWPLLLTRYEGHPTLPEETTDVTILGGTAAVAESTEAWLLGELGEGHVDRIGGNNRYDTGVQLANFGIEQGLFWDGAGVAVGTNFPDALSGGAMLGKQGTILLLTPGTSLSGYVEGALGKNKDFIEKLQFLGGTGAVSQDVRDQAMGAVE